MSHSERFHENFKIQNADIQQNLMKTKTLVFKECTLKRSNESAGLILFCELLQNQPQSQLSAFFFNRILAMCVYCAL